MMIETKHLSPTEIMLFFSHPLPLQGTFYHATQSSEQSLPLMHNIAATELAAQMLLTADFIYLNATTADVLEDLTAITLAELDEYNHSSPSWQSAPIKYSVEKINIILKTLIAPLMQRDGGDIELQTFTNQIATVKFLGKCHGCPYAQRTLKECVAKNLMRYLPEVKEVVLA